MEIFLSTWHEAARTSVGFFWMAFWAFSLGYLISSMIQVFVTRSRMRKTMGETGPRSVALGTFFGFLSSSCSFAALSTTRSLFSKGAGLIPALAFMLSSTNLVIELGIIIALFLSWQFVVGEYVGGILLILVMWLLVRFTLPEWLEKEARDHTRAAEADDMDHSDTDWKTLIRTMKGWKRVGRQYVMEWDMVWKDVTIGFTVAGIIASFVSRDFFQMLFLGSGNGNSSFLHVLGQAMIGPVAAFFTFIGSMGNIPLAAVLFGNGVSFAGVMAFMFSDMVVLPVLRVQATYYGWRMALYILGVLFVSLVSVSVMLHYGLSWLDMLPDVGTARIITDREFFALDYTFVLNILSIGMTALFLFWKRKPDHGDMGHENMGQGGMDHEDMDHDKMDHGAMDHGGKTVGQRLLTSLAVAAYVWLGIGLVLPLIAG